MDKKFLGIAAILLFLWMNKKPQPKKEFGFQVLEAPEESDEELPDRGVDTSGGAL